MSRQHTERLLNTLRVMAAISFAMAGGMAYLLMLDLESGDNIMAAIEATAFALNWYNYTHGRRKIARLMANEAKQ